MQAVTGQDYFKLSDVAQDTLDKIAYGDVVSLFGKSFYYPTGNKNHRYAHRYVTSSVTAFIRKGWAELTERKLVLTELGWGIVAQRGITQDQVA